MSPVGFEQSFPTSDRPQTHALDRAASGIGKEVINELRKWQEKESGLILHGEPEKE